MIFAGILVHFTNRGLIGADGIAGFATLAFLELCAELAIIALHI